jgi:hypothetical protein
MTDDHAERLYSLRFAADAFEVTTVTVRNWSVSGKLASFYVPDGNRKLRMIPESEIRRMAPRWNPPDGEGTVTLLGLDCPIECLGLCARVYNALDRDYNKTWGIPHTVAVVVERIEQDTLKWVDHLGKGGLEEIKVSLEKVGQAHDHQERPVRWYDAKKKAKAAKEAKGDKSDGEALEVELPPGW